MEVEKDQHQEIFPGSIECEDFVDEDDDDGHFVIALDDSGQDHDELDGFDNGCPQKPNHPEAISSESNQETHQTDDNSYAKWGGESCEILHLECTPEAVESETIPGQSKSEELLNESVLSPGLLKETNRLPDFIRCTPEIIKRLKSSLIDHTDDKSEQSNFEDETISSPSLLKETNKLQDVIPCSPVIIKRLKSSLIGHSVATGNESSSKKEVKADCESVLSSNKKKNIEVKQKLHFTPRDDCSCIMCNGWSSSKFHAPIPENLTSTGCPDLSSSIPVSHHIVTEKMGKSNTSSNHRGKGNFNESSHTANYRQKIFQIGLDVDSATQKITSKPSLLSHDDLKSYPLPISPEKQLHSLLSNHSSFIPSKVSVTLGDEVLKNSQHHISSQNVKKGQTVSKSNVLIVDGNETNPFKNLSPVLFSNGGYYTLVPQSRQLYPLTKPSGIPLVPKMIPYQYKDGIKSLVLTRDFISSYKPNLIPLLNRANKLDLSNSDKVYLVLSENGNNQVNSQMGANSTKLFVQPAGSATSAVCSLFKDTGNPLPSSEAGDMLLRIIYSHFKINPQQNLGVVSNIKGNFKSPSTKKLPPPLSQPPKNLSKFALSSSQNHLTLPTQGNTTDPSVTHISQSEQPLSLLPPPPPLLRCPTAPISKTERSSVGKQSNELSFVNDDEHRKTLIIPLHKVSSEKKLTDQNISSQNVINVNEDWSSNLYTFSAPAEMSPVKVYHVSGKITNEEPQESIHHHSKVTVPKPVITSNSSVNVPNFKLIAQEQRVAPIGVSHLPLICVTSSVASTSPLVRVNLSSNANILCSSSCAAPTVKYLKTNEPMLTNAFKSCISSPAISSDAVVMRSYQDQMLMGVPVSVEGQKPVIKSSVLSMSSDLHETVNKCLPVNPAIKKESNSFVQYFEQGNSKSASEPGLGSHTTMMSCSDKTATCTTTKSASALIPSTCPLETSRMPLPSTTFSSTALTVSSSSSSLSSSSVTVTGLKLKIRLGDVKTNFQEVEDPQSEKYEQSSNTIKDSNNSFEDVGQTNVRDNSLSAERVETAEEMFQRFQEQAMQQVYNAQFGVGDLSRNLRPSRCNISFVDKPIPRLTDEGKKRKPSEENRDCGTSGQPVSGMSKKIKPSEESKNDLVSSCVPSLSKSSGSDNAVKGKKKRQYSNDSGNDTPRKEPRFDINSYPKMRQDNSILMRKTIYTPNIMAGHKVFAKFNIFSNAQSNRTFLAPFFNLGGSREQFDVEDMEYLKKAVVETEKDEKFCARHLLYYSRERKKATFLRKENFAQAQLSDLSEKSYKKCSYILEGFSRESVKRSVLLPEEWKVDKKVSIEIDTAETDNISIDFANCDDDAITPEENDVINSEGQADTKVNVGDPNVSVNKKTGIASVTLEETQFEQQDRCVAVGKSDSVISVNNNQVESGTSSQSPSNTNSPSFRPNILRKKTITSKPNHDSNLTSSQTSKKVSLQQSSPDTEVNYTDQLKELFTSGCLQRALPSVKETDEKSSSYPVNEKEESVKSNSLCSKSLCSSSLDVFIKKEISDDEYGQGISSLVENSGKSLSEDANKSAKDSSTNIDVKSEPVDEYFESLERKTQASPLTSQVRENPEMSLHNIANNQVIPVKISNESIAQRNSESNENDKCLAEENPYQLEHSDEDTVSAFTNSPAPSSSVSESSDITTSSCTETSDEFEDDSDGDSDLESVSNGSSSIMTISRVVPETSELYSQNVAPNSTNTKITSLVESLKQRLKENSALPPVYPKAVTQPKKKSKKAHKEFETEQPIPKTLIELSVESQSVLSSEISCLEPEKLAAIETSSAPVACDKDFTSPSELSHVDSLSPLCPSSSSSTVLLSENISNNVLISVPVSSDILSHHTSQFESAESDVSEFKKRFPFITSGELCRTNPKESTFVSKGVSEKKNPLPDTQQDTSKKDLIKAKGAKEEKLVVFDNAKENVILKDVGGSVSRDLSNSKDANMRESTTYSDDDIDVDTESDIDVSAECVLPEILKEVGGSVNRDLLSSQMSNSKDADMRESATDSDDDIDVGTEMDIGAECVFPEISNSSRPRWPFSSPPIPANGRKLRDFSRESELFISKESIFNSNKEKSLTKNQKANNVSPKKFTLPLRPRTKRDKRKVEPPKAMAKPSVASILCQKLDISIEPIIPKLKGKLVIPLECTGNMNVDPMTKPAIKEEKSESEPSALKVSSPKPINPTFKPSINAIFGVEKIPHSVDTFINKQDTVTPTSKPSLGKTTKSPTKRHQMARKGTTRNSRVKPIQKEQDKTLPSETKPQKETEVKEISTDTDVVDSCSGDRYHSLRKFAWRKSLKQTNHKKEPIKETDESIENVKNENSVSGFAIKPCVLQLHKFENMQWGSNGGPVLTEQGTYLVKDVEEQNKQNRNSEVTRKRKKKSGLKRTKKSRAARPKKDIVDFYAAAIESLRRKALLLEEDEKRETEKKERENKVSIKVEVDASSDPISSGEINVKQDIYSESCSTQSGDAEELSNSIIKMEVDLISYPHDSENVLVLCSNIDDSDNTKMSSENQIQKQTMADDKMILKNENTEKSGLLNNKVEDISMDCIENYDQNEDSQMQILHGQDDRASTNAVDLKSLDSNNDKMETMLVAESDNVLKGNRRNVLMVERNYEGDHIHVYKMIFQDQDDIEEMVSDNEMEDSEEGDKLFIAEDDIETIIERSDCERKDDRTSLNVVEKDYEGKCAQVLSSRLQNKDDMEEVGVDLMETPQRPEKQISVGSERQLNDSESHNIQKSFEKKIDSDVLEQKSDESSDLSSEREKINLDQTISKKKRKPNTCNSPETDQSIPVEPGDPGSIFTNKDIVLGFEDELGAETVLSKLGPEDMDDDMFLMDDSNESENIGLIPDDEVERLLGLELKTNGTNSTLEEENRNIDEVCELNVNKLSWKLLPVRKDGEEREHSEHEKNKKEQELKHSNEPEDESGKSENELCNTSLPLDRGLQTPDKLKSPDIQNDNNPNERSMSPERITTNGDNKATRVSPSWKRILGTQALKEIQESVTTAIASANAKQGPASGQKTENIVEQKQNTLKNDKLKLKLCTGALSKALKLPAKMRKSLKDSPTESCPEIRKFEMQDIKWKKTDEQPHTSSEPSCSNTRSQSVEVRPNMEKVDKMNKDVIIINQIKTRRHLSECQEQTSPQIEVDESKLILLNKDVHNNTRGEILKNENVESSSNIVFDKEDCDMSKRKFTEICDGKMKTSKISEIDVSVTEYNSGGSFSELERLALDKKKLLSGDFAQRSTNNIVKVLGNKIIDLTKLKMKLNPLLAAGKTKLTSKDSIDLKQVCDNNSELPIHVIDPKDKKLNIDGKIVSNPADDESSNPFKLLSKEPSSIANPQTKQTIMPPILNKEKLSNILKNFKKPTAFTLSANASNSSKNLKDSSLSKSVEKDTNSASPESKTISHKPYLRKRNRSPQQNKDVRTKDFKKSRMSILNEKQKEVVDTEDRGERSCFDCLSEITTHL